VSDLVVLLTACAASFGIPGIAVGRCESFLDLVAPHAGIITAMPEISAILSSIEQGDAHAPSQLLPLVYDELRQLAAHRLTREAPGQTLQPTALVHEAYLRLVNGDPAQQWHSRGHFFAAAAEAMRRILVEQARRKRCQRHAGGMRRVELLDADVGITPDDAQILLLDDALSQLSHIRPQAAEVVKLRFFAGMTIEEAASVVGVSPRTARRLWMYARAWLRHEMDERADSQR
jgi:RNA polymerase sigma factor (TIGR02999 family)